MRQFLPELNFSVKQAMNIDVNKSDKWGLRTSITKLKARYNLSSRALRRQGLNEKHLDSVDKNLKAFYQRHGEKRIGEYKISELRELHGIYKNAMGYSKNGVYNERKQMSLKGFREIEEQRDAKAIAANPNIAKMDKNDRKNLYSNLRKMLEETVGYDSDEVYEIVMEYGSEISKSGGNNLTSEQLKSAIGGYENFRYLGSEGKRIAIQQARQGRTELQIASILFVYERSDYSRITGDTTFFENYSGAAYGNDIEEAYELYLQQLGITVEQESN